MQTLVDAADAGLHPWVRHHFPAGARRAVLAEELEFWLGTAAQDMSGAENYRVHAPDVGEPAESYLAKWLPLEGRPGHVLIGPRYLGLAPEWPFVGTAASDRPLVAEDAGALARLAREVFGAFRARFVMVNSSDPVGAWPATMPERRVLAGTLQDLRERPLLPAVRAQARRDTDFYDDYVRIHEAQVACEPAHARRARCESKRDLEELGEKGLLFDVIIANEWAGLIAAEAGVAGGMTGAKVKELILDHPHRRRGYGASLSALLARSINVAGDQALFGTIHYDNTPAYRSALAAGRVDVGGEIIIPL